jgi:hypothetical protein
LQASKRGGREIIFRGKGEVRRRKEEGEGRKEKGEVK